ncbi:MAG: DUF695 domain-containing protein [Phycisphaerales bacterium]|nr:DUF695 domain-containing protein [Phycisphaerales bacterium]
MGLFGRRFKDISKLPAIDDESHEWGVIQVEADDGPLVLRCNTSAAAWQGHPQLPIKLGMAVALKSPNPGALPDPEENERLFDVEDAITREVGARTRGILVLALTNGVMKEWVFYVQRDADISAIHAAVRAEIVDYDVSCIGEMDEKWQTYREYSPE